MSKTIATIWSLTLIVAILVISWIMPMQWGFLSVMGLMVIFFALLGVVIAKQPLGVLINEQNVTSLSRFQTALWTVVIISAFLVIAMARIKNGVLAGDDSAELGDPMNIVIGKDLLGLLGITAVSMVGSPLIAATKKSKRPASDVAEKTAKEMMALDNVPQSVALTKAAPASAPGGGTTPPAAAGPATHLTAAIEDNAEGFLYRNPTVSDASFTDLFEGNEVGNAAHVDLSKVQMFFFTTAVAVAYAVGLWDILSTEAIYGPDFAFPAVSTGMVGLLGISNFGYLTGKAVDHTPRKR